MQLYIHKWKFNNFSKSFSTIYVYLRMSFFLFDRFLIYYKIFLLLVHLSWDDEYFYNITQILYARMMSEGNKLSVRERNPRVCFSLISSWPEANWHLAKPIGPNLGQVFVSIRCYKALAAQRPRVGNINLIKVK